MRRVLSFIITIVLFNHTNAMEKICEVDQRVLSKVESTQERIRYYLIQKNLPEAITLLKNIKYTTRFLSRPEKINIHNELVRIVLKQLSVSPELINSFEELYHAEDKKYSCLSSNDSSPRVGDNSTDVISEDYNTKVMDNSSGELSARTYNTGNKKISRYNEFVFISGLVDTLEKLQKNIKQAQSELRIACYDGNARSFMQKFTNFSDLYGDCLNINDLNGVNKGLLHYAVDNECQEILDFLLMRGANIEIIDMYGNTPLLHAVKLGKRQVIDCLLNYHANPYMMDTGGLKQKNEGSYVSFDTITKGSSIDSLLAIRDAKKGKRAAIKKALKNYRAQLADEQKFRFMAQAGRLKRLRALVSSITKKYSYSGTSELLSDLINSVDPRNGKCALHLAIDRKQKKIIIYLIGLKADLNIEDFEGNTPLHYAVMQDYYSGVFLLLFGDVDEISSSYENHYKGADAGISNKQGYSSEKIALLLRNESVLRAIRMKQAGFAGYKYNPVVVGENIYSADEENNTSLLIKVSSNDMPKLVDNNEVFEEEDLSDEEEFMLDSQRNATPRTRRKSRAFSFGHFKKLGSIRNLVPKKDKDTISD